MNIITEPNFNAIFEKEIEIEENIINNFNIPIETNLRIGYKYTAYECTIDEKYHQEIEQLKKSFKDYGYNVLFIDPKPNNKIMITFKI